MRAKDKVERLAQEIKEKERQESMARQHRHQDTVAQSRQASTRGPFRDFPRGGRVAESRPGAREWRERRKPSRAIPLPAAGQ
ncbi:la-related protein [Trichonephila clavipes]|nr:la-related protein [Trichonephila clavipes]